MDEFKELVLAMRTAQKEYFRTRDSNILVKSKQLEKEVDQALEKYEDDKFGKSLF